MSVLLALRARVEKRAFGLMLGAVLTSVVLAVAAHGTPASGAGAHQSATLACPLRPTSSIPSGQAWAFTVNTRASGSGDSAYSTYAHGRGTWGSASGGGTICRTDTPLRGVPRALVLAAAGGSHVNPGVIRQGRLGVALVLRVTVTASDFPGCTEGARGTVSIFASYYQSHHDIVTLRLGAPCAGLAATYHGPGTVALVARDGREVSPS